MKIGFYVQQKKDMDEQIKVARSIIENPLFDTLSVKVQKSTKDLLDFLLEHSRFINKRIRELGY